MSATRLRRAVLTSPGYRRRRAGKGFCYFDPHGTRVTDREVIERFRALAIPPAWREVWICPYPGGHIQAVGLDVAGRRQYLYHELWRRQRAARKFDHVLEVATRLPTLRRRIRADLRRPDLDKELVLAVAVALIDLGLLRVGSDQYAVEHATYGAATLLASHVRIGDGSATLTFSAKGSLEQTTVITESSVVAALTELRRRRRDTDRLLAYREESGTWRDIHSSEINDYLRVASRGEMTAKDLRTWHATVYAAVGLARAARDLSQRDASARGRRLSPTARKKAVAAVIRGVAHELGDTAAVTRNAYVDPRITDLFLDGRHIELDSRDARGNAEPPKPDPAAEKAVLALLA